ncbi:hypothetical protein [Lacticaseibacillus thailandensis]|nr:hypothetical protein [Lacticaseibacillus thailandensis]
MTTAKQQAYPTSNELAAIIQKTLATPYVQSQQPLTFELNSALRQLQHHTPVERVAPHLVRTVLNYTVSGLTMPDELSALYDATYREPTLSEQYGRAAGLSALFSHIWFH